MARQIIVNVRVVGAGTAAAQLNAVARTTETAGKRMRAVGAASTAVGAAMLKTSLAVGAVGVYAAKSAMTFNQSMERIKTQAHASQAEVDSLSKSVLDMAKSGKFVQDQNQMANALYHLESIGLRLNTGVLPALKTSLDLAAVGGSDAEETATALGAAWTAMGRPAGKFNQVASLINSTVGAGNMRMQDLVTSLGTGLIPAFRGVGLTAPDALAAVAALVDNGYKANIAATQLGTGVKYLIRPSSQATKALAYLHIGQSQLAKDLHQPNGLLMALRDLKSHLDKLPGGATGVQAGQLMAAILPPSRGKVITSLLNYLDLYDQKLTTINQHLNSLGGDVAATKRTPAFQFAAAWSAAKASITEFGAALLPIVSKFLPQLVSVVKSITGWFDHLSKGTKDFIVKLVIFTGIAGGVLMIFGKMITLIVTVSKAWEALTGIMMVESAVEKTTLIGVIVAALVLIIFYHNQIAAVARRVWHWVAQAGRDAANWITNAWRNVGSFFSGVWHGIASGAQWLWMQIKRIFSFAIDRTPLGAGLHTLLTALNVGKNLLHGNVGGAGSALLHGVGSVAHALSFGLLGGSTGGLVTPRGIKRFQMGGPAGGDTIPAWLSAGEGVLNRTAMAGLGVGGLSALNSGVGLGGATIQPGVVFIQLDGRTIARAVVQYTLRTAARGPSSNSGGALVVGKGLMPGGG